jgi:hypothetical protein
MTFIVTAAAQRPARMDGTCFYCGQPIGAAHKDDCVLIKKRVRVRAVIEYEIDVPAHWTPEQVEWHRNEGTWCADNLITELGALAEKTFCLCGQVTYTHVADTSGPTLEE